MQIAYIILISILTIAINFCNGQFNENGPSTISHGLNEYSFEYRTPDGTFRMESGKFENGIWTVRGLVEWFDATGMQHIVNFVANDNGYSTFVKPVATSGYGGPKTANAPPVKAITPILKGLSFSGLTSIIRGR